MGSAFCCFNVKDPTEEAQDNIDNANHNETPGFFAKLYNKIKEYGESSNKREKDVDNSSSESGSTQEEFVSTVQSPDLQGSNLEQQTATPAPDNQRGLELNSNNLPSGKKVTEIAYFYPPIQHEDECPTCLEEYTPENPKKTMQCSHNFHLACIYEWMERSHTCPICCRVMLFDEIEAS